MEKGESIVVTKGCYDEYMIERCYRAMRDVEDGDMFRAYIEGRETTPSVAAMRGNDTAYSSVEFSRWAVENGYLEPIYIRELHLGDYGNLDPQLYCLCESRTDAIHGDPSDPQKHRWIPHCDFCDRPFPDDQRPAKDEEVWAQFPWMRPKEVVE